jgi:choline dehydrogenase
MAVNRSEERGDDGHDYVIVGAGSAGSVLAARLSEDPTSRVLLLEAGGSDRVQREIRIPVAFGKLFRTDCDWAYETEPEARLGGRRLYWPRGRVLGGCSSINAQMWLPGEPADYDGWAAAGASGWSFADVRPYVQRAEQRLHVQPVRDPNPVTLAYLAAAEQAGLAASLTPVTQRRGRRWSAVDGYLRPAQRRRNLVVQTRAHARRVMFEGRRAIGVEYVDAAGRRQVVRARREVVLSAGALGSPQLLMLSGIGPADRLRTLAIEVRHHAPEVGQNLQDHLAAGIVCAAREPVTLVGADRLSNVVRWFLTGRGPLASNLAEACGFVRSDPGLPVCDLELIFAPYPFVRHGAVHPGGPGTHAFTVGAVLLHPRSVGEVRLVDADSQTPIAVAPRYLSDADGTDLRTLLAGLRLARRVVAQPALAAHAGAELLPGADRTSDADLTAAIEEFAETLYHPVGSCRMGDDEAAVVDPSLRVRGVERLRVVDASVMPRLIGGHTHAPTVMIAERAADLIREQPI